MINNLHDFGWAIRMLKDGYKVCRHGWNGKNMFIWHVPGSVIQNCQNITDPILKEISDRNNGTIVFLDSIRMKTATGEILTGWLASQTDIHSNDWEIYDFKD